MVPEDSLVFPVSSPSLCFQCSPVCLCVFVCVCVSLGVALLAPSSTLLAAISSSPLPVCSPASHHFISLQYIYPGSSFTHHQIVVSAQVVAYTSGLSLIFSDFSKFGLVTNCFFFIQCPWTITCELSSPLPPTPSCLPLPFSLTPLSPPVLSLSLLHPHSIHLHSPLPWK